MNDDEQKEQKPFPWLVVVAVVAILAVVGVAFLTMKPHEISEAERGAHASQMSDSDFSAFKLHGAPKLLAALSDAAFHSTKLSPLQQQCVFDAGMERLSKKEVETFYVVGHVPQLADATIEKHCIRDFPEGRPHIAGTPPAPTMSDTDQRYYVLQKLQKICNNDVATRYGNLEVRGRNYCACIATKELAAMKPEDLASFEETGRIKLDKTQQDTMVKQCTPQ